MIDLGCYYGRLIVRRLCLGTYGFLLATVAEVGRSRVVLIDGFDIFMDKVFDGDILLKLVEDFVPKLLVRKYFVDVFPMKV